ncbi:MFS transporter [Streptomyces sp. SUK 48]|uniref:MFS transporter n=1 Tax=Streptomyces sp. SUK 48 TaxID=2582831 RepID=UPI00129BE209|nr:MFS transporter [Streptomyces sp. SUK 48]
MKRANTPTLSRRSGKLVRQTDAEARSLRAYWVGESTSLAGSFVHAVALPVVAVVELHATPRQVSLLAAAATAAAVVLALPAGVVGDRCAKRPLMVATDLTAAAVVTTVPLCWATGSLSMPVLYVVALLLGVLTVFHQAASIAIVPDLVRPQGLPSAHSRIGAACAVADTAGTYGGTLVVALAGAARTLWLDALSYFVSACCALRITPGPAADPQGGRPAGVIGDIREGVGYVMRDAIQRPLVLALTAYAYADGIVTTYTAYTLLTRLHAGSTGLGVVMGVTGAGGLAGALLSCRITARFGPGRTIVAGFAAYAVCGVPLLVARPGAGWLSVIAVAGALKTAVGVAAGSTHRALRQQLCPPHLQSRAQQTAVWLASGVRPLAALTAGGIAAICGVRAALLAGTVLYLIPAALVQASRAGRLAAMPCTPGDPLTAPDTLNGQTRSPA